MSVHAPQLVSGAVGAKGRTAICRQLAGDPTAMPACEEPGQPMGEVVCRSRLGGLLNEYTRQAA